MICFFRIFNSRGVFNKVGVCEFLLKIVVGRRDFVSIRFVELIFVILCSVYYIMVR